MKKGKIYIGTSGWNYKEWKGLFYPENIKEGGQLEYYTHYFDTVEINNSFYMLPAAKTFSTWRKAVPRKFLFAVKASRFITHMKKLNVDMSSIHKFFNHAGKLEEKMGPILFQLPPRWKINTERLKAFLKILPGGYLYTFEFRDHTWYDKAVYGLLKKHNCAFCIYDMEYHLSPIEVTADFVYIRLHGPDKKYQGNYTKRALKKWADRCLDWQKQKKDVYIYFDNTMDGNAVTNALQLMKMVKYSLYT